jgi:hypothetical protein
VLVASAGVATVNYALATGCDSDMGKMSVVANLMPAPGGVAGSYGTVANLVAPPPDFGPPPVPPLDGPSSGGASSLDAGQSSDASASDASAPDASAPDASAGDAGNDAAAQAPDSGS